MGERFNFSTHYIKIRKLGGKIILEVWELYTNFLMLQVPLSHYTYIIEENTFIVVRK
jgi:hypothetical protein